MPKTLRLHNHFCIQNASLTTPRKELDLTALMAWTVICLLIYLLLYTVFLEFTINKHINGNKH